MINKRLFLSGGGDEISSKEIDNLYGKTLGEGAKVLYLPVAWEGDASYESCLYWFTETYKRFGFQIEMLTNLNACTPTYLNGFDSIYIGGGNTFSLLHTLKKTGFLETLIDFINSGKVVYGGSAGAIILGKDISTASIGKCSDLNKVEMTDLSGLNMIKDYTIHCHYEKSDNSAIEQLVAGGNLKVLALGERSDLYVDGDKMTSIGEVLKFEPHTTNQTLPSQTDLL